MKVKIHSALFWLMLIAAVSMTVRLAAYQPVLVTQPTEPPTTIAEKEEAPGAMDVFVPSGAGAQQKDLPKIFRFGPVNIHPHANYRFLYGDGIQSAPTNQQKSIIQELSPGILVELGRHWSLDYTPTIRFYSNDKLRDGVDHAVSLSGGTIYGDWKFGLAQSFLYTTAPTAETGTQTEQETFGTAVTASRILNNKLSLDLGVNQNFLYADQFQSSREWSTLNWLNYEFWPRLNAGIGAGVGYVNVDTGADQFYEQLQLRVNWRATDKLRFSVNAGGQDRQFLNVATTTNATVASDLITPTFGASIEYLPFKDTEVSLSGSRSISPSLFQNSVIETTTVSLNLHQKLAKKFQLNLGAGYTETDYTETIHILLPSGPVTGTGHRTDESFVLNARLSRSFLRRGTWGIFWQYNDNKSTSPGFSYQGSQVGFDVSYSY